MKHSNKIISTCFSVALGMFALTGCEGGELFDVNAPDWISDKIQEIEDSKNDNQDEIVLEGMMEDVYTIGNTDYTSGWWAAFSKYYVIPDGQKWNAVFNLNINPSASNTYKNFALIICSDADRDGKDIRSMVQYALIISRRVIPSGAIILIVLISRVHLLSKLILMTVLRNLEER